MADNFEGIKNRRFGIEIEMTGITRCSAAKAIRDVLGGEIDHVGGSYDKYKIYDEDGRAWSIVFDASIDPCKKNGDPASDVVPGLTAFRIRKMCISGELTCLKAGKKYHINKEVLFRVLRFEVIE